MARVFVVDDSAEARMLCKGLEADGYEVTRFDCPAHALEDMRASPPDVVIAELMLPGTTGLAFCRSVRACCPETKVVLTGAYHLSERQLVRADCGAAGFVPKPFGVHEFAQFLESKVPSAPPSLRAAGGDLPANR